MQLQVVSNVLLTDVWIDVNNLQLHPYNAHLRHVTVGVAYLQVQLSSCLGKIQLVFTETKLP